jgi:hypothetical protein
MRGAREDALLIDARRPESPSRILDIRFTIDEPQFDRRR